MRWFSRFLLVFGALAGVLAVTLAAGLRQGLLALLGIGFGAVLQGARFGFTTGWRDFIERRDPQGLWAQMLLMVLAAALTLPLLAGSGGELVGAVAPLTISLVLGAFLFGAAMQLADGCGSGTLYKAGGGSPLSFVVLPTFAFGSFLGASHQPAWIELGGLPAVDLLAFGWPTALALTVAGCGLVAWLAGRVARNARGDAPPSPQAVAEQLVRTGTASFVAAARPAQVALGHALVARRAARWPCSTCCTWSSPASPGASSTAWACGARRRSPRSAGTSRATPSGAWRRMRSAWSSPSSPTSPR